MSGSPTPPGWYHDPAIPGGMRWWDGTNWTTETRPVPPPPPLPPAPPPPAAAASGPSPTSAPPATPTTGGWTEPLALGPSDLDADRPGRTPRTRSWWQRRRVLVPAGVVALAIVASVVIRGPEPAEIAAQGAGSDTDDQIDRFAGSDEDDDGDRSTTTDRSTSTSAATGSTATTARATSSSAAVVTEDQSSTSPTAGNRASTSAPPATRPPSTTTTAQPTSSPTTGSSTTTRTTTTLAPTTTAAPTSSGCDPNYSGACVPIASDVDCLGGSGNGPAYVQGPVTVVGADIYGLDADNDGIGCETG